MRTGDFRRGPTSPVMLSEAKRPDVLEATWRDFRIVASRVRRIDPTGLRETSAGGAS